MSSTTLSNRKTTSFYLLAAACLGIALGALLHAFPHALAALPVIGQDNIDLPKPQGTNTVDMVNNLILRIVGIIRIILEAVAVAYIVFTGAEMIINIANEDMLKKKQNTFLYAIIGFVVLNIGNLGIAIFSPANPGGELVQQSGWIAFVNTVLNLIKYSVGTVTVALLVVTGFKILSPRATKIDQEKKHMLWMAMGLFFIMIADLVQKVFVPTGYKLDPNLPAETLSSAEKANALILNVGGTLLTIMGPIALFLLILSGFYYITANGQEDRIKKAKNIFVGTFFAVIIAYSAYALVSEVIRYANFS